MYCVTALSSFALNRKSPLAQCAKGDFSVYLRKSMLLLKVSV